MSDFQFDPADLTINAGDTVTWINTGGFHDTVSGANGVPGGVWDSKTQHGRVMFVGESFSFTFNAPGTFPYYCTPHWRLGMMGTVQVMETNAPPPPFEAKNDFNHDGQSDFLWQHRDGRVKLWLMDGVERIGALLLRNARRAAPGSRIVGTHDFDRDDSVDILWQRRHRPLEIWFMRATNFLRAESIIPAPGIAAGWHVAGLGDFNRDAHADILLRHSEGYLLLWYLKGKRFLRQRLLHNGEPIPPLWRVAGVADLNDDGCADILWQKRDSSIAIWFMAGETPVSGPLLSHLPRLNARIVGVNDLDQDGELDFIWRHRDGHLSVWWMNQTNFIDSLPINAAQAVPKVWTFAD